MSVTFLPARNMSRQHSHSKLFSASLTTLSFQAFPHKETPGMRDGNLFSGWSYSRSMDSISRKWHFTKQRKASLSRNPACNHCIADRKTQHLQYRYSFWSYWNQMSMFRQEASFKCTTATKKEKMSGLMPTQITKSKQTLPCTWKLAIELLHQHLRDTYFNPHLNKQLYYRKISFLS